MKTLARPALRSAATSISTMAGVRIRALTERHPIKPTSPRCHSAWQLNLGRHSTYRRGKSVQTTGTTSVVRPDFISPVVCSGRIRPCRVFPFSFAEKPIVLARHFRQPFHILLRIGPAYIDHRPSAFPPSAVTWFRIALAAARVHARLPFIKRDIISRNREASDRDRVLWLLI